MAGGEESMNWEIAGIIKWLNSLGNELILNVGGPRESECSSAYEKTVSILNEVIETVNGCV